jgi:hypothetical protein
MCETWLNAKFQTQVIDEPLRNNPMSRFGNMFGIPLHRLGTWLTMP